VSDGSRVETNLLNSHFARRWRVPKCVPVVHTHRHTWSFPREFAIARCVHAPASSFRKATDDDGYQQAHLPRFPYTDCAGRPLNNCGNREELTWRPCHARAS
jgi:hypothetical protein